MQFPHEKLSVYQKALDFFRSEIVSKPKCDGCLSRVPSIVNCLANSSETNCFVNFAENYFEWVFRALSNLYAKWRCTPEYTIP